MMISDSGLLFLGHPVYNLTFMQSLVMEEIAVCW